MTHSQFLLGLLFAWIALVLVAAAEFALREFSHREMERRGRTPHGKRRVTDIFQYHDTVARALTECRMVLLALFVLAIGFMAHNWLAHVPGPERTRMAVFTFALVLGLLLTTVWIPWAVARLWAEPLLFYSWPLWRSLEWAFAPLKTIAQAFDGLFLRLAGRTRESEENESFEEELLTIVAEGQHDGAIESDAREMIEGVIELSDAPVSRIMTTRTDIVMLGKDWSWEEITKCVLESGHSRLPVFGSNRDDVEGIVHVKDMLPVILQGPGEQAPQLSQFLRAAFFVPETKNLRKLLKDFRDQRQHMALVVDEYGGVSGLVTIEDILEEIVGEIVDEHDDALQDNIRQIEENLYEVQGREHVDDINDQLHVVIPEGDDYETVAGYIFKRLGYVPTVGERIELPSCIITIAEASLRTVNKVRIEVVNTPDATLARDAG